MKCQKAQRGPHSLHRLVIKLFQYTDSLLILLQPCPCNLSKHDIQLLVSSCIKISTASIADPDLIIDRIDHPANEAKVIQIVVYQ